MQLVHYIHSGHRLPQISTDFHRLPQTPTEILEDHKFFTDVLRVFNSWPCWLGTAPTIHVLCGSSSVRTTLIVLPCIKSLNGNVFRYLVLQSFSIFRTFLPYLAFSDVFSVNSTVHCESETPIFNRYQQLQKLTIILIS